MRFGWLAPLLALAACGLDVKGSHVVTQDQTSPPPADASRSGSDSGAAGDAGDDASSPGDAGVSCTSPVLAFDGVDDFVTVPQDPALDLDADFTVEAWVKPGNKTTEMHVVSHHDTGSSTGWLLRIASGRVEMVVYGNEAFGDQAFSAGNSGPSYVVPGKWAHVAGTLAGGTLRIYYDGTLRDAQDLDFLFGRDTFGGPLVLGRSAVGEANAYEGQLDDVRLSDHARATGDTIAKPAAALPSDGSTVALYAFDEAAGASAVDGSGHAHDGVLGSGPSSPTRSLAPCAALR